MTHPAKLQLIEFLDAPDDQASNQTADQVSLHLAVCKQCRAVVNDLTAMMDLIDHAADISGSGDSVEDETQKLIIRFLEGKSTDADNNKLNALVENDSSVLKYMMQYRLFNSMSVVSKTNASRSLFERYSASVIQWMKNRPMLGWQAVPAVLAVAFVVNTVFIVSDQSMSTSRYVSFQNNPVLTKSVLNSKIPGIGFFNQANTIEQPYGQVQIKVINESLIITWPVISKVNQYTFSLWKSSDKQMIVDKKIVSGNVMTIESSLLMKGISYNWEITANTTDGYHVATEGGIARN